MTFPAAVSLQSCIPHSASHFPYPTSCIPYPVFHIPVSPYVHSTSHILDSASHILHLVSHTLHPIPHILQLASHILYHVSHTQIRHPTSHTLYPHIPCPPSPPSPTEWQGEDPARQSSRSPQVLWGPSGPRWTGWHCLFSEDISLLRNTSRKSIKNPRILAQLLEKRTFRISPQCWLSPTPGLPKNSPCSGWTTMLLPKDGSGGLAALPHPLTFLLPSPTLPPHKNPPEQQKPGAFWTGMSHESLDWHGHHRAKHLPEARAGSWPQNCPFAQADPGQPCWAELGQGGRLRCKSVCRLVPPTPVTPHPGYPCTLGTPHPRYPITWLPQTPVMLYLR